MGAKVESHKTSSEGLDKETSPYPTEKRREAVQSLQTLQTDMESKDITAELLEKEIKEQRSTYQSFRRKKNTGDSNPEVSG
jgi:hypothetical protein